jgi:hypothetical protein
MRIRGGLVIAVLGLVLAPAAARADELSLGLGLGFGADLGGDVDNAFSTENEAAGRIITGLRRHNTQFEVSFFGTDIHLAHSLMDGTHSTLTLGAGLKQYVPIVPHVELYARAALDYTWLEPWPPSSGMPPTGFSGRGWDYGAGIELGWRKRPPPTYHGSIDSVGVVVWLDAGRQHMRLETDDTDAKPMDGRLDLLSSGFSFTTAY